MNEAQTRRMLIDKALARASWDVGNQEQVGIEIPVDGFDPAAWKVLQKTLQRQGARADTKLPSGISDYVLYRGNGEILAVVEAKRASFDPRNAQAQLTFYLDELEKHQGFRPFGFTSNGYRMYFYEPGAVKREVFGFFSKSDLERLLALRQSRKAFLEQAPAPHIAGRPYQVEAIRRTGEAFEHGKRKALLVMATGTGKTRTVMSIIDVFSRANQARNVLFVADRDALVTQALNSGFKTFLPDEPCVRLTSANVADQTKRLYAVTLQTLGNIYESFTPGFSTSSFLTSRTVRSSIATAPLYATSTLA